jgi:hypothetical protein
MCELANRAGDNECTEILVKKLHPEGEVRFSCQFNLDDAEAEAEVRAKTFLNYGLRRGITDFTIVEARGLKNVNFIRSMDPYTKVTINGVSQCTRVHDNGHKNPTFKEKLPPMMVGNVDADIVTVEIWDKDSMSDDDLIATGSIRMCELANKDSDSIVAVKLHPEGEVRFSCQFNLDDAHSKDDSSTVAFGAHEEHHVPLSVTTQLGMLSVDVDGDGTTDFVFQAPKPGVQVFQDLADVDLRASSIVKATYGPSGTAQDPDFTQQVNSLLQIGGGRVFIKGGAHIALGDPAPGQSKQLVVTFMP